jgi:hypothetical protein
MSSWASRRLLALRQLLVRHIISILDLRSTACLSHVVQLLCLQTPSPCKRPQASTLNKHSWCTDIQRLSSTTPSTTTTSPLKSREGSFIMRNGRWQLFLVPNADVKLNSPCRGGQYWMTARGCKECIGVIIKASQRVCPIMASRVDAD